jgi:hypothetical protein
MLIYQKDGPGSLLRCYLDRIHFPKELNGKENLNCAGCNRTIGTPMIYKPEQRPAFRMRHGMFYMG